MSLIFLSFVGALAGSQKFAFSWPDLTGILLVRIKVINFVLFLGLLVLSDAIFRGPAKFYQSHRLSSFRRRLGEILLATGLLTALVWISRGPFKLEFATNQFLFLYWVFATATLIPARELSHWLLRRIRIWGRNLRQVVVVGDSRSVETTADCLRSDPALGYRIGSVLVPDESAAKSHVVSEVDRLLSNEPVDELFLALPHHRYRKQIQQIVRICEEQGVLLRVRATDFRVGLATLTLDRLDETYFATVRTGPSYDWQIPAKRMLDFLVSGILIVVLGPLFALLAVLIRLDSRGPIFFRQERIGWNMRRFQMLKFRTMVKGAEAQQPQLENLNEMDGPAFKIKQDPRVTKVGRFLRRLSLDELPQLFNVLRGDMSLVGPRPLPLRDVEQIAERWHRRRFSVKPGLTCLWQVHGRNDLSFERWIRLDLEYIDRWSLALDFKILAQTVPSVLRGSGAY